jgi:hypothetical protein
MKQYLLSIHQPDGPPPADIDFGPIVRDLDALNQDLRDAGAWVFGAPLHPASTATVLRVVDGETLTTDGPYVEGKEHIGGLTIIRAPDLDAALVWAGRLATVLSPLAIEVRPFEGDGQG